MQEAIAAQVEEVFSQVDAGGVVPHVADRIEPGAILYSSWGYDQTNIAYYLVTRTTKASAWIVPMRHAETPAEFMAGWTTPLEPITHSDHCANCGHVSHNHRSVIVVGGEDYRTCTYGGEWNDADSCGCRDYRPTPIVAKPHRIRRSSYGDSLHLTSFNGAYLWDGRSLYATHYA